MTDISSSRPKTWGKVRRGNVPTYEYKTIDDVRKLSSKCKEFINIYGVVCDYRPVEKSKGLDFFCILRIVDPSYCEERGIKVTLFHRDQNMLPKVDQLDIIRLHRVCRSSFKEDVVLLSSHGWSWVSWPAEASLDLETQDESNSSSKSCTILDEDKKKVQSLRDWLVTRPYLNLDQARNACEDGEDKKLCDVASGAFFNLVCQVTGIVKVKHNFVILKVWDSTLPSHKIEPGDYSEVQEDEIQVLEGLDNLNDYMVDVSIFDNHVETVDDAPIELGCFVRFCNLYASPKRQHGGSQGQNEVSDLYLQGGTLFNRGVVTLDSDCETVESLKMAMRRIIFVGDKLDDDEELADHRSESGEKRKLSSGVEDPPSNDVKKQKLNDAAATPKKTAPPSPEAEFVTPPQHMTKVIETFKQSQDTLCLLNGMDSPAKRCTGHVTHDKAVQVESAELIPHNMASSSRCTEDSNKSLFMDTEESQANPRCHQTSATVVFGENSPLRVTSIRDLLATDVAVTQSKLFRIRAKICKHSDLDNIVFHFCPASGLRISAKNDGEPLELTDEAVEFIRTFREQSIHEEVEDNEDKNTNNHTVNESSDDGIAETQWFVVNRDEEETMKVDCYENPNDKSKWETLKLKENITRKRKQDDKRFVILYREDHDCASNLNEFKTSFNRVIRVCPKEKLMEKTLPSVAFQDGIYYYCSPGCVGDTAVPSLKDEAHAFNADHPRTALGSPILSIIFDLQFVVEDDTDVMTVTMKDENAVAFFNGVTSTQYLLNKDSCYDSVCDDLKRITCSSGVENSEFPWVEMVIEKKSRKSLSGSVEPVTLYELVNTRLAE